MGPRASAEKSSKTGKVPDRDIVSAIGSNANIHLESVVRVFPPFGWAALLCSRALIVEHPKLALDAKPLQVGIERRIPFLREGFA